MDGFNFNARSYLARIPNEIQTQICTYLSTASLAKLAVTCRTTHGAARRVLYLRNATEENSSAVKYAILVSAKKYTEKIALRIIDMAISHGAQLDTIHSHPTIPKTYATALHMAAALGYCLIVKRLLQQNACVTLASRNLWDMIQLSSREMDQIIMRAAPCFTDTLSWCPRRVKAYLAGVEWLPLFVPFILKDKEIINLLLSRVPDCRLTLDFKGRGCGALTALHVIAAKENQDENLSKKVLQLSTNLINEKLPGDAGSALHVALRQGNESMFQLLVNKEADLNLQTHSLGYAPIHIAIIRCYESDMPERKVYQSFIELLVDKGADLDRPTLFEGFTPLMTLVGSAEWDWKLSYRNMKQLVDLFLAKGCRVNHMAPGRETFVSLIIERITEKNGNPSLEALLEDVIDKGANLNIQLPNGKSIAKAYVIDSERCPRLAKLLVKKGARINDEEVDSAFLTCFKNPRVYKIYQAILDKKPPVPQDTIKEAYLHALKESLVSQDAIDEAYLYAVESRSQKLVDELRKTWGFSPSNTDILVWHALQDPKQTLMDFVLELDFNANTIHLDSGSYLHLIVGQLAKDGYTEKVAIINAKALIEKGTSVLQKDGEGKTAIQRLRESDEERFRKAEEERLRKAEEERLRKAEEEGLRKAKEERPKESDEKPKKGTDKLRLLLLDQKDRELGEY
ncbi:unnamed protein product [Clonostachys rosea f. rosea IK726]|uniref:Uncharacterized protein n=1 Tax=Clonostachys rosea f. rosea IK726 TaxID=1349383 RepID=A0ACA9TKB8_BIOOC|nr:unnamed protein product [Clonostachys rosea f. rosea IK726]